MNEPINNASSVNFPESWTQARNDGKNIEKRFFDYIIQGIALTILSVVTLPLLPIYILCRLGGNLKEKIVSVLGFNKTLPAVQAMKQVEESNKFQAMKDVFESHLSENGLKTNSAIKEISKAFTQDINFNSSSIVDLMAEEYKRLIIREISRQASAFNPKLIPDLASLEMDRRRLNEDGTIDWALVCKMDFKNIDVENVFKNLLFDEIGGETAFAVKLSEKMRERYVELKSIGQNIQNTVNHIASFISRFNKLTAILKDSKNLQKRNPTQANREFIAAYRDLLKHPIYKALKLSPSNSRSIKLIEDFSAAIWNSVDAVDAYKSVGKAIIADGNLSCKNDVVDPNVSENIVLANKLRKSQETVVSSYYHNDSVYGMISYAVMHFWPTMGGFASMGGAKRFIPSLLGVGQYDSHGTLSNNPSKQGTTTWKGGLVCGKVNNCYGGSPTIGDYRIAPEFKAFLQAAENNLMQEPSLRRKKIPSRILYGSFQNSDATEGEGPRNQTIMHCNEAFPLSFTGYVLAKDSSLYTMHKSESIIWEDAQQFGEILKEKLMLGVNTPTQKGHGFYFSGSSKRWETLFDAIIDVVNKEFIDKQAVTTAERRKLQAAYQDHVYSLINVATECSALAELNVMGVENPTITTLNLCKESADRGVMENLKVLLLRIKNFPKDKSPLTKDELLEIFVGFMNSRALSARDRAILKHRVDQVLPFIETISPEDFERSLLGLLANLGLDAQYEFSV